MKFTLLFLCSFICLLAATNGQDDHGSDADRPLRGLRKPLETIGNLGKRIGERVREASDRVKESFQTIIQSVRQRTEELQSRFREEHGQANLKYRELMEQLDSVMKSFNGKKEEYIKELEAQKGVIDNHKTSSELNEDISKELEEESQRIDEKVNDAKNKTIIVPQVRGLGDGYGRILK